MSLLDQINEIIKQNIPEQLGKELRDYLADYESLKILNQDLLKQIQSLKNDKEKLDSSNTKLILRCNQLESRIDILDKKEDELKSKELQQALDKLAFQKEAEKVVLVTDLVKTVFKNKEIIHETYKDSMIPVSVAGGNNYSPYVSSQKSTENTITKIKEE